MINKLRGLIKSNKYQPTAKELEFMRSRTWEAAFTNHPKNYPLQQYGVTELDSKRIISTIRAYIEAGRAK